MKHFFRTTRILQNINFLKILQISARYKHPSHHWSVLKKKKTSSQKALDHFDDFYKQVYGESWKNIRSALLSDNHKYIAVINNFSDTERICEELENLGAMNIKNIYNATKHNIEYQQKQVRTAKLQKKVQELDKKLNRIVTEKQQFSIYPDPADDSRFNSKIINNENNSFEPIKLQSIETNINVEKNNDRIIKPSVVTSNSQLYEYIPATKLKGMDDFVLESEHYDYYNKGADFSIRKEKEFELTFPNNLLLYTFEEGNFTKFPKPKTGSTQLQDYFVLDGASILPVLSLDLKAGDTFLDMCAAPGGKTLIALQTLSPRLIVSNDVQESRVKRINKFVNEFLLEDQWNDKFFITQSDARYIEDTGLYNKILVDVPCTTDRHVLHEDDNNIFKGSRIKERLRLPELQSQILTNALKLAIPGGTVVYSTCSLSPIQNDGVVQMALKKAFEEYNVVYVVKDQTQAMMPLQFLFNFGDYGLKYGHIVVPSKSRNWGPIYFCKMVRIQ